MNCVCVSGQKMRAIVWVIGISLLVIVVVYSVKHSILTLLLWWYFGSGNVAPFQQDAMKMSAILSAIAVCSVWIEFAENSVICRKVCTNIYIWI